MKISIYQVDAFAEEVFQGNPAAVCPLEGWLPDSVLQAIAEENNLSETAFFVEEDSRFRLRWFTPVSEVDLCGHATLATAHVLFEKLAFPGDEIRFQTRSGELRVSRKGDLLAMDFPAEEALPVEVPQDLVTGLGGKPGELFLGTDYLAIFSTEAEVRALQPDFARLKAIEGRGVIVSAPGDEVDFVSRFFAPKYGIDEDPVTGSAHCLLAPYWAERLGINPLTAEQISSRTGRVLCEVKGDRVLLSGKAVLYLQGTIELISGEAV